MSADKRDLARLKLAAAELRADLGDLGTIRDRIAGFSTRLVETPDDAAVCSALALWLDHYYTACEAMLGRLLASIDGLVPSGEDWHARLLRASSVGLPGLRPPLVSQAARGSLDELRGFRHKLRHTYLLEIDPRRIAELAQRSSELHPILVTDLQGIARWLDGLDETGA